MRDLPSLSALRAFEAAARRESFKLAAADLHVTSTAISHQIRQLETNLGVALFIRQTRKVSLTEEGRRLFAVAGDAFEAISTAARSLRRHSARNVATISATVAFTARMLVPNVARFRALHPDWNLRLDARDDAVDLVAGDADAAIRYGLGRYPGLETIPLLTDTFAPMCSPHLGWRTIETLSDATLIHFDWGPEAMKRDIPTWRSWATKANLARVIDVNDGIAFNDESNAIQAAIAGQGIALLSRTLLAKELAAGTLIEPFGPVLEGMQYDFVFPTGGSDRAAVMLLRDWVTTQLLPHEAAVDLNL